MHNDNTKLVLDCFAYGQKVRISGYKEIGFAVDDLDAVVTRLRAHGAELIGEMQYENTYRLAYIRGPEGIIVALAEQLS